jgi:hypothetical protein
MRVRVSGPYAVRLRKPGSAEVEAVRYENL